MKTYWVSFAGKGVMLIKLDHADAHVAIARARELYHDGGNPEIAAWCLDEGVNPEDPQVQKLMAFPAEVFIPWEHLDELGEWERLGDITDAERAQAIEQAGHVESFKAGQN